MQDNIVKHNTVDELNDMIDFALDVSTTLLASGAHCGRVNRNVNRILNKWNVKAELYFSHVGVIITGYYTDSPKHKITHYKQTPPTSVNFTTINEISQLSWMVDSQHTSLTKANTILQEIKKIPVYPRWMILLGIGMSCGFLCMLAGGDWRDAIFAFVSSICGMFARIEFQKRGFNGMVAVLVAAFVTTFVDSWDVINILEPFWGKSAAPESALATSVLYLVPGVPLMNCIIELIEGYIPMAIARGLFGGFVLLCIAVGMSVSILLFGVNKF